MCKLRALGIGMILVFGVMATACGEIVYQVGTVPPPAPPAAPAPTPEPPPPPPPEPEPAPLVEVKGDEIKINEKINFAKGSSEIESSSTKLIESIANVMKKNPNINFVEIAGHASREGSDATNKALTKARAEAVLKALEAQGVEKNRMRSAGYSFHCELNPDNPEANRRVEFKILKNNGALTSTKSGGCDAATAKGMAPQPVPATAP